MLYDPTFTSFYWPSLARKGARSLGGALYWMRSIKMVNTFINKDNKDPLICAMPVARLCKILVDVAEERLRRPIMPLGQVQWELAQGGEANKEELHLSISQLWARKDR